FRAPPAVTVVENDEPLSDPCRHWASVSLDPRGIRKHTMNTAANQQIFDDVFANFFLLSDLVELDEFASRRSARTKVLHASPTDGSFRRSGQKTGRAVSIRSVRFVFTSR